MCWHIYIFKEFARQKNFVNVAKLNDIAKEILHYEKTLLEQISDTYTQQGDYMLPCLTVPAVEEQHIGIW